MSFKALLLSLVLSVSLAPLAYGQPCIVGDLDEDCRVDFNDLWLFAGRWLDPDCLAPDCEADLDGHHGVNMDDFALLAGNWLDEGHWTTLVINELMAKNDGIVRDERGDADDWVEIYNYGDEAIDVGGMYMTDRLGSPGIWRIPDSDPVATTIAGGGYLLIWADDEANEGTLHARFKLSADGEQVGLFDTDGRTMIDGVTFGPQAADKSYGRIPDGNDTWQVFDDPSPRRSNRSQALNVVINEIMYHPHHGLYEPENIGVEYIELFNSGGGAVRLAGWRFTDGVDFVFPDVTIVAGQYLVVAADVNAFSAKYPGVANVVGGWTGRLSNSGEEVELSDDSGVVIDTVYYADQGDWAERLLGPLDFGHRGWIWSDEHDGGGKSLELINPAVSNEYGQNWAACGVNEGTPGGSGIRL